MRKKGAFTLIELLVVISIIALLLAILTPTLQRVRRQAKTIGCQSNLRQWSHGFEMYCSDNDGWLPAHVTEALPFSHYLGRLERYLGGTYDNLHLCPMAHAIKLGPDTFQFGDTHSAWVNISKHWGYNRDVASYGRNSWHCHNIDSAGAPRPIWESGKRGQMSDYRPDSIPGINRWRIPVLLDARWAYGGPEPWSSPPQEEDGPEPPSDFDSFYMWPFIMNRHSGGINGLFMDWSVRKVELKKLWTVKWHPVFDTAGPWTKAGGVQPSDWPKWMRKFKDY